MTGLTYSPNSEAIATLEIMLPDRVSAQELQALLAIAQYVYSSEMWLSLAAEQPFGIPMPDEDFVPAIEDQLLINYLTIGTPNCLKFLGKEKGVSAIVALLTALMAVPTSGTLAYKTYAEAKKIEAETVKILMETKTLESQQQEAERLKSSGQISEQSCNSKANAPYIISQYYTFAYPLIIRQEIKAIKT